MVKHHTRHDQPRREALQEYEPDWRPLLEAQVVEVADSIAYDTHDLDDSLSAGIIRQENLKDVEIWQREAHLKDVEIWQREARRVQERFGPLSERDRRIQTVRSIINEEVGDLLRHTARRIEELKIEKIEDVRKAREDLVSFSPEMQRLKSEMQAFMMERVYRHYRVIRMANKAKRFLEELFKAYLTDINQLPPAYKERVEEEGKHRVICDYIAGMTDRFAQDEFIRLFHPYERV